MTTTDTTGTDTTNADACEAILRVIDNDPDQTTLDFNDLMEARLALRHLFKFAESARPDEPYKFNVTVLNVEGEPDINGESLHFTCGHPGCDNHALAEWDEAQRDNDAEIDGDQIRVSQNDAEFNTKAWMCGDGHVNALLAGDYFNIEWS